MRKYRRKVIVMWLCYILITVMMCGMSIAAEESIEDQGISVYSLGENGENILVKGVEYTVADYGDAEGYEVTSALGDYYVEYRDDRHHSMHVSTSEGATVGYCMQPYMNGPSVDAYTDYNYVEGFSKSSCFSSLGFEEREKWKTEYVIGTKYGFGGIKTDPNYSEDNIHDGGTFGTYLVEENGAVKVVKGLMIGGKVYEMTKGEATALTQVLIHYVGNNHSDKNITGFKGYTNPGSTDAAFKHMKAYADGASAKFDGLKNMNETCKVFDNYVKTTPSQTVKIFIYDFAGSKWVEYSGQVLNFNNMSADDKIKIKVEYYSKNLCNKLITNESHDNITVSHNYNPFVVDTIKNEADFYDYISIGTSSLMPINIKYDMVKAGKEKISNELLGNMQYDIDTFSQEAQIEIAVADLLDNGGKININVNTGMGSTAALCYDETTKAYSAKMYSCDSVQDCLMLASHNNTKVSVNYNIELDMTGSMELEKVSEKTDITDNNPCYDMNGAEYNVYLMGSNKKEEELIATFVIKDTNKGIVSYSKYNQEDIGKSRITKLPLGAYIVRETKAPTNGSYMIDQKEYFVRINEENYKEVQVVKSTEKPVADPIPMEIIKECSEGDNVGGATLEGAEFTVWYYKEYYESYEDIKENGIVADKKWIFGTRKSQTTNNATSIIHKELLLEGSDEPYTNDDGDMILPLGTIVIEETKAPEGYTLENASYYIVNTIDGSREEIGAPFVSKVYINQGTVKLSVGNKIVVADNPIRGDLKLSKVNKHTGEPMSGIPFLITSKSTGESHVIVTDENGVASTSAIHRLHTEDTNGNDDYLEGEDLKATGVWFVGYEGESSPDDEKGALPYDTYTVKELSVEGNQEFYLSQEFEINVTSQNEEIDYGKIENIHKPEIGTFAFDKLDEDKLLLAGTKVSVIDRVSYKYLEKGKTYILRGTMVNKKDGEGLLLQDSPVEASIEFVADKEEGTIDVLYEFELSCQAGDKLVVYEYLYDKETGELVASHEDIECEDQTLTVYEEQVKGEVKPPEENLKTEIKPEETPKTGDESNLMLVSILMGIAAICFVVVIIMRRLGKNT